MQIPLAWPNRLGWMLGAALLLAVGLSNGVAAQILTPQVNFDSGNGALPEAALTADASGSLAGATDYGGTSGACPYLGCGTVFKVTATGFLPPNLFVSAPRTEDCAGHSTTVLAQTYGGLAHATEGLGYDSVADLRTAIATYCGG